ncbi:MAG: hypothetical protein KJ571_07160 [Bacteroidetes bacterium]|nr:hypothetical protein [Bacteroidota bacterium]
MLEQKTILNSKAKPFYENAIPVELVKLFLEFIPEENHQKVLNLLPVYLTGDPVFMPHGLMAYISCTIKDLIRMINRAHPEDLEIIKSEKQNFKIFSCNPNNELDEIEA